MNHDNDNYSGLTYLSVCSGIEAASVAWHPLGWKAVAYSEIEKFPSAVLGHHYPDVPNLGDFTKIDTKKLGRVDILAGGTPCQAFSVAGLRQSLADARGNLSLEFVRLAHELADGNGLRNVVWENVVGVLSTKDNAFGCFPAGLVGADTAIVPGEKPADGKSNKHWRWSKPEQRHIVSWPRHGMVSGPKGRAAWAVKDAQFFGVAQRRRRVLVVADFGNGADPAAVLFEPEGVLRYPPTRGEAGKDVAPTIGSGAPFSRTGNDRVETEAYVTAILRGHSDYGPGAPTLRAKGGDCAGGSEALVFAPEIARCVATREGSSQDYETTTMVAVEVAPTMRAGGNNTGGDRPYGTDVDTCDSLAIVSIHADSIGRTGEAVTPSADASGVVRLRNPGMGIAADGTTYNLMASGKPHAVLAFDTTQITSKTNRSQPKDGDPCHPLSAGAHPPAVTVAIRGRDGGATAEVGGEVATALRASQGGGDKPHVLTSAVRRLTPTECERLQGFPDGYTDIPWRGKPNSPDGPRYKALGNSWAVPKFEWLGRRIQMLMPKQNTATEEETTRAA